ncbi:maker503 [Drosophila busckii]|uniref:Maker503 n=1 Tax=Drosophila busckii TaxID=30019 RepID=A0A0M4E5X3_DROBS|nr:maker503 [Drosophila busckii]
MSRTVRKFAKRNTHLRKRQTQDAYLLICTECFSLYPPRYFSGQFAVFRMCRPCQRKNVELCSYLEKYVYEPLREKRWEPFQVRLDRLASKCEELENELKDYKRKYCEPESTAEIMIDNKVEEMLDELLDKCAELESERWNARRPTRKMSQDDFNQRMFELYNKNTKQTDAEVLESQLSS